MAYLSLHIPTRAPRSNIVAAFGGLLGTWRRRAHERRELASLDHRTIRDVGLSPSEVQFEASKPFWRA
ncbi:MAG: DUF1127 domain-containing protein [Pseudomonadota bacterium]